MKRTLLYVLAFTYMLSMCKPVMPYLSDAISHTFYYAEHIKKVHIENGKQHVHYELVNQNKNNNSGNTADAFKKISLANDHLLSETYIQSFHLHTSDKNFRFNKVIVFSVYPDKDFPPPRC